MNLKILSLTAILCGSTVAAFGSTHVGISFRIGAPPAVHVRRGPPPRIAERVVVSPGPGYVWVAGYHTWTGRDWAWVPGAWVQPPQADTVWVASYWDAASQNWVDGHWEVRAVSAPVPVVVAPATPAPGQIVVNVAPPALRHEVVPRRPSRRAVWVDGFWVWRAGHHVWVAGHWEVPPRRHAVWVSPRWERRGGGWVFIDGRWR